MNNFKRRNQSSAKKYSVDGFVRSAGSRSASPDSYDRGRTLRPQQRSIGDFRASDGFHPATKKPAINTSDSPQPRLRRQTEEVPSRKKTHSKHRAQAASKQHKEKRHIFRKAMSTLLVVFLVAGGYLFGKGYLSLLQVFRGGGGAAALYENVDPSALDGEGDGRVNILLLGRGGAGHAGADLTDTILVASIDPINRKTALLSIPRDLYVKTDGYGSMKINSIFATGKNQASGQQDPEEAGLQMLEETLEDTIGIPIHYNVLVDFEAFKQAIDIVGGVTVDVPEDLAVYETYGETSFVLNVDAGQYHFDGETALAFSRSRKTSPRGDFDRSARQRLILVGLKDKVFSLGTFGNPVRINQLLTSFGDHVSSNLKTSELLRLYEIMQQVPNEEIASVGLADPPNVLVTTANIGGLSVVVPKAGTYDYTAVKHFVRNALRDGFLSNEDATVDVYNGTLVAGLAGRTAEELKSFGYNVNTVADAPSKGRVETVLVDLTNGEKKYTKTYLEQRFSVTAVSTIPDPGINAGDADFVIILGQNEESRLEN